MVAVLRDALSMSDAAPDDAPPSWWRRRPVVLIALAGLIVILSGVAWFAIGAAPGGGDGGPVPLIRAETGPAKLKPDSPGGIDPPGKDKLIYNRMAPGQSGKIVERARPRPETPVAPPRAALPAPTIAADSQPPVNIVTPTAPKPTAPVKSTAPVKPRASAKPTASPRRAIVPPRAQTAARVGAYRIQVAALRSRQAARRTWSALLAAHGAVLGGLTATIERVDLGASKGVYFRVQGGPFADAAAAARGCAALRRRSVSCFVVRD